MVWGKSTFSENVHFRLKYSFNDEAFIMKPDLIYDLIYAFFKIDHVL